MAACLDCGQEMTRGVGCTLVRYTFEIGTSFLRLPVLDGETVHYGWTNNARHDAPHTNCGDCGAPIDGLHHPGCCVERCPQCYRQAISCDCEWG